MFTTHPFMIHLVAEARRQDLLATAVRERQIAQIRAVQGAPNTVTAAVRVRLGNALVRAGQRVQGARRVEPAGNDALAAGGVLRTAR